MFQTLETLTLFRNPNYPFSKQFKFQTFKSFSQLTAISHPKIPSPLKTMDEKVAKWIIEFLLRKPVDEKIINGVLSSLPLSKSDNRLKKTLLLRKIESEMSNGSVSEKLLELLEIIEELDHKEGKIAMNLMKKAYCLVAVDCTVRFLEENVEINGKYFETVERIWRNRVCLVDGLSSEELNRWLGDIEAAVWDSGVREKILMLNTRKEALKAVKCYLKEAWESMGPTFLELVAKKVGNEVEEFRRSKGGGGTAVCSENPCPELVASQGTPAFVRRKHVAVKSICPRGAKISDVEEEDVDVANDVRNHTSDKLQETVQSDLDASQAAHDLSSAKPKGNVSNVNAIQIKKGREIHATAEVNRVQYALRSSSRELHAAVTDPLPEAYKIADTLSPTGGTENRGTAVGNERDPEMLATPKVDSVRQAPESNCVKVHAADRNPSPDSFQSVDNVSLKTTTINMNNDPALEVQIQPEVNVPRESTDKNMENVEKKVLLKENAQSNVIQDPKDQQKRKRSLMDANGTSHTLEWSDSSDNLSRGLRDRPRLPPSPNRSNISPLRQYEEKRFRRERKKWNADEEDVLRDGVRKFGRRWNLIRSCYTEAFKDRTDVDLKDKWRNLEKYER